MLSARGTSPIPVQAAESFDAPLAATAEFREATLGEKIAPLEGLHDGGDRQAEKSRKKERAGSHGSGHVAASMAAEDAPE